uniref:Gag-pol polyprotein n=1 Tax=Solanum tuberosum TaxID=4113 RepID=M1DDS6_SOLTU
MSVKEYALMFTQLSKYSPTMIVNSRALISSVTLGDPIGCHEWIGDSSIGHFCRQIDFFPRAGTLEL